MEKVTGALDIYFETGSEGVFWVIYDENQKDFYGLTLVEQGDYLKVFDEDDTVLFDGEIVPDYETGWMEYPLNPGSGLGQQCALGWWVHWIQKGWQPDDWASLFIRGKDEPKLRAELVKK